MGINNNVAEIVYWFHINFKLKRVTTSLTVCALLLIRQARNRKRLSSFQKCEKNTRRRSSCLLC
jgi:hypothetical protein